MKTALIIGAAAVVVYAIWRTQQTVVSPGAATGNAVADMTPSAAAQTKFGGTSTSGLLPRPAAMYLTGQLATRQTYDQVLGEVARREFAPLATTQSPGSTRYQEVGVRGVLGTAPNGTPAGITDPPFVRR